MGNGKVFFLAERFDEMLEKYMREHQGLVIIEIRAQKGFMGELYSYIVTFK